jgi:hypothetical protein
MEPVLFCLLRYKYGWGAAQAEVLRYIYYNSVKNAHNLIKRIYSNTQKAYLLNHSCPVALMV